MKQLIADCLHEVDELLRGERTTPQLLAEQGLNIRARRMVFVVIAMGMIYGLCMGSFSLLKTVPPELAGSSDRYMQVLASVVKTPALFFLTLLVTLPSLYVFNALVGSRLRPLGMFRLLFASLAVNTTVLASLGPIVAFFSVSTSSAQSNNITSEGFWKIYCFPKTIRTFANRTNNIVFLDVRWKM